MSGGTHISPTPELRNASKALSAGRSGSANFDITAGTTTTSRLVPASGEILPSECKSFSGLAEANESINRSNWRLAPEMGTRLEDAFSCLREKKGEMILKPCWLNRKTMCTAASTKSNRGMRSALLGDNCLKYTEKCSHEWQQPRRKHFATQIAEDKGCLTEASEQPESPPHCRRSIG